MELMKHNVRVSFEFDVTCNDEPIGNSRNDLALLKSFLTADKTMLLHMMVDAISTQIGLNSTETFVKTFLCQIDTNSHVLFSKAIEALRGDEGEYWREEVDSQWPDVLTLATEKLFECFSAQFVSSKFEVVEDATGE